MKPSMCLWSGAIARSFVLRSGLVKTLCVERCEVVMEFVDVEMFWRLTFVKVKNPLVAILDGLCSKKFMEGKLFWMPSPET